MAKKSNLIGSWAFLIGVIFALIIGVCTGLNLIDLSSQFLISVLIVLGLIIGFFNITGKEVTSLLLSGISLIIASFFGMNIMSQVPVASATLATLLLVFIPAIIIVAIKNIFSLAKS